MKTRSRVVHVVSLFFLPLLTLACGRLAKQTPSETARTRLSVHSEDCSETFATPEGAASKGILRVAVLRDHFRGGKAYVAAKGFLTTEPLGTDPHAVIGDVQMSRADEKKLKKSAKLDQVAPSVILNLGTAPVANSELRLLKKRENPGVLQKEVEAFAAPGTSAPISIALNGRPYLPAGMYLSDDRDAFLNQAPFEIHEGGLAAATANGHTVFRSLVVTAGNKGSAALSLPDTPEPADAPYDLNMPSGKVPTDPIKIQVAPDQHRPADIGKAYLIVELEDAKKKWRATCVAADLPDRKVLTIPTAWKDEKGGETKMPGGEVRATISRVYQSVSDGIIFETATGAVTSGTIAPEK